MKDKNLEDIKKIIDSVIADARNELSSFHYDIIELSKSAKMIYKAILKEYDDNKFAIGSAKSLETLLTQLIPDSSMVAWIFNRLIEELEQKSKEVPKDDLLHERILKARENIKARAVLYFKKYVYEDIKNLELTEKLKHIKGSLFEMKDYSDDDFFKIASLTIKQEIENEIELVKEAINNRNQIKLSETSETNSNEQEAEKNNLKYYVPRNEKQVFLALEIMLRLLRSTGNMTDKGKLMSFLSGYSSETMRQCFSKSENWKDKREDLHYIHGLCSEFGLSIVRKEIEKEIAILDKQM
jgi:hypothetical protein